jgi:mannose-6-phosphate isomerase-like protein (cupin superfamily)
VSTDEGDSHSHGHGHSNGHGHSHDEGDPEGPRRKGKLHYHEEEVRPLEAYPLFHRQPHLDLYADSDRRHPGRDVDIPLRTIQLHIGRLDPGQSTNLHKHHNEAAIYIIEGAGHSEVQGEKIPWEKGDFIYIPTMQWHTHVNPEGSEAPVLYMGITNKRMLDWLGLDRKVEAGRHVPMEDVQREIDSGSFSPYSHYSVNPEQGVRFGPEGFITHGD